MIHSWPTDQACGVGFFNGCVLQLLLKHFSINVLGNCAGCIVVSSSSKDFIYTVDVGYKKFVVTWSTCLFGKASDQMTTERLLLVDQFSHLAFFVTMDCLKQILHWKSQETWYGKGTASQSNLSGASGRPIRCQACSSSRSKSTNADFTKTCCANVSLSDVPHCLHCFWNKTAQCLPLGFGGLVPKRTWN